MPKHKAGWKMVAQATIDPTQIEPPFPGEHRISAITIEEATKLLNLNYRSRRARLKDCQRYAAVMRGEDQS